MNREEAIKLIAFQDCANCSEKDRELIVYNSWGLDESDEVFYLLPDDLKEELIHYDEPQDDIMSSKYDMLVGMMCKTAYDLYSNEKLAVILSNLLGSSISVEGDEPQRYGCPCCKKELLSTKGEYDICSNCGWEDDGNEQEDRYSSPNHMTLAQGKENYRVSGNCMGNMEREKFIRVPKDKKAVEDYAYGIQKKEQMEEMVLSEEQYYMLDDLGVFDTINEKCNILIDEYEEEVLELEQIPIALEVVTKLIDDNENKELVRLKELLNLAVAYKTIVGFDF